jgi:hypothetical protein
MWTEIKNRTIFTDKYQMHPKAAIVSCFFNPQKSEYRKKAFDIFYNSIKHLPYLIVEGVIGNDEPSLPQSKNIVLLRIQDMLWHKETLLNKAIALLPKHIEYVFWVDADVIFANKNWIIEGVQALQTAKIIQPFEYCIHLERDEIEPSFKLGPVLKSDRPNTVNDKVWRSFSSNYVKSPSLVTDTNYNNHGHVGFAWGAGRKVLESVPLYDRALIGGADHIIAHAAAGQFNHPCIQKSFTDDLSAIEVWSRSFYAATEGRIGYVKGALYHIWHGDIAKRNYLKRIQEFTPMTRDIREKDEQGFYRAPTSESRQYYKNYLRDREVPPDFDSDGFMNLLDPLNPLSPISPFNLYEATEEQSVPEEVQPTEVCQTLENDQGIEEICPLTEDSQFDESEPFS